MIGRSVASCAIWRDEGIVVSKFVLSVDRMVDAQDTTNISPWLGQVPLGSSSRRYGEAASLADQAYYALRELIVSLELAPGERDQASRELTARLGIGRTPVREALRRLALERLVEVYPRRGMFVTTVDVRDLARLCEVRAVLEPEAARLAAERATRQDLEEINALLEELAVRRGGATTAR